MKNYLVLVLLLAFSSVAFSKEEKVYIKEENMNMVAVKGLAWGVEYYIDTKAKLCFAVWRQGITLAPCENMVAGYPELKSVITWAK